MEKLKLNIVYLALCLMIAGLIFVPGKALAAIYESKYQIGSDTYYINGKQKKMDVVPFIENDRLFVPVRYIAYGLGLKDEDINYVHDTAIIKGKKEVRLTIGVSSVSINGSIKNIDAIPTIKNDRIFLPVRYVTEALDGNVEWQEETRTAIIRGDGKGTQEKLNRFDLISMLQKVFYRYNINVSDDVLIELINNAFNEGFTSNEEIVNNVVNNVFYRLGDNRQDIKKEVVQEIIDQLTINNANVYQITTETNQFYNEIKAMLTQLNIDIPNSILMKITNNAITNNLSPQYVANILKNISSETLNEIINEALTNNLNPDQIINNIVNNINDTQYSSENISQVVRETLRELRTENIVPYHSQYPTLFASNVESWDFSLEEWVDLMDLANRVNLRQDQVIQGDALIIKGNSLVQEIEFDNTSIVKITFFNRNDEITLKHSILKQNNKFYCNQEDAGAIVSLLKLATA
ncbi:MAG: copper amine oxidase N-terminal domain-containing protein [Syntrophomonadaceae bacterium]|nr:copper amine oxidase N-terminal domain-containing protein [Syntrophomonadaceae bacterium]